MMRSLSLTVLALLAACAQHGGGQAKAGSPAPPFTESTLAGKKISLAGYRGKAVYLNFFASWCPPCNAEAPAINALQKRYAARGLQIVGVDELDSRKGAQNFVDRYRLAYPAVIDDGLLQGQYLINGLPVHVFIGRDGVIKQIVPGEMSTARIESSIRAVLSP